jgi:flagellar basal body-associated protein FliL
MVEKKMADETNTKEQEKQENPKTEKTDKKTLIGRLLPWIILGIVAVISAGAGFGVGRLFAGSGADEASQSAPQGQSTEEDILKAMSSAGAQKTWYYDLEPVVANLDEPNVTRYIRAVLTLEMNPEMDEKKGKSFLDEKKPILTNWLAIYLASLGLEDIRGERNLKSIQSQILDVFNEKLFPNSKPQIKQVLFKEFAIQ